MIPAAAIQFSYIAAAVLFIMGLKMLGSARTARRGNLVSALAMLHRRRRHPPGPGRGVLQAHPRRRRAGQRHRDRRRPAGQDDRHAGNGRAVQRLRRLASLLVGWAEYHRALQAPEPAGCPPSPWW
jgi:hypothetical protein